jgi:hypothetical protein
MSDGALLARASQVDVFAEVEPNQKERIILALGKAGHVVGYMGDGINDASAPHAADVGLSIEGAVDVAREVADIVLLEKNLEVLVEGVREERTTFANTLKYVLMATSANFGNMFSMAGASLLLPFLPFAPLLGLTPCRLPSWVWWPSLWRCTSPRESSRSESATATSSRPAPATRDEVPRGLGIITTRCGSSARCVCSLRWVRAPARGRWRPARRS